MHKAGAMGESIKPLREEERSTLLEYGRIMVIRAAAASRQRDSKKMEEAIRAVRMCLDESKAVSA
jgi:hypothetical protein